jgi:hypothetical protein
MQIDNIEADKKAFLAYLKDQEGKKAISKSD